MGLSEKLGTKYACYNCGRKFYDLNRGHAVCPVCRADQSSKTNQTIEFFEEEEILDEDKIVDDEDEDTAADALEEELPEMEEDLGYDETDEEE